MGARGDRRCLDHALCRVCAMADGIVRPTLIFPALRHWGVLPLATSRSSLTRSVGLTYTHASIFRMPHVNLICAGL